MINEHQEEIAFLRQLMLYEDTAERRELEERIVQVQRDACCVQRVTWLMALLSALAAAGLAYGAILQENFPYNQAQFVIKLICVLGLASLICLVTFLGLLAVYRGRLKRLRVECRCTVRKLLEFHLGSPPPAPARDRPRGASDQHVSPGTAGTGGGSDPAADLPNLATAGRRGCEDST